MDREFAKRLDGAAVTILFGFGIIFAWIVEDDLAAAGVKPEGDEEKFVKLVANLLLLFRWNEKEHKTSATCAGEFTAEGSGTPGRIVNGIHFGIGDIGAKTAFGLPCFMEELAKADKVAAAIKKFEAFFK